MDFINNPSRVFIKTDESGKVIAIDGGYTTPSDLTDWVQIDEGYGDKYNLCQGNYLDKPIMTHDGIYQYRYINNEVIERTKTEIEADRQARNNAPALPTELEQLRADVDFLLMMEG